MSEVRSTLPRSSAVELSIVVVTHGAREMTLGLVGNNLLNENIRNSVSYTKDEVLMPGIGVRAFANLKF